MGPPDASHNEATPGSRPPPLAGMAFTLLAALILLMTYLAIQGGGSSDRDQAGVADASTTTTTTSTSTSTTTVASTTTSAPLTQPTQHPSVPSARYVVPRTETVPEVKQLAADIAVELTTYEASVDHPGRLEAFSGVSDVALLSVATEPLTYAGLWSRGEVIYPQLGGLTDERASVMVMTRQVLGSGFEELFSYVRTLDIRLKLAEGGGWEFDFLNSAGGTFDDVEDLTAAHAVAADPRIEMSDSARLDILSGLVSPTLLSVMADLADETPYGVIVLATGHPHNVFETDRQSHHTVGQAVDIYRIGDRHVIDDRDPGSKTRSIASWLYDHPDVLQVGGPWDLDGAQSRRSFTNLVHQDHIHLAVDG